MATLAALAFAGCLALSVALYLEGRRKKMAGRRLARGTAHGEPPLKQGKRRGGAHPLTSLGGALPRASIAGKLEYLGFAPRLKAPEFVVLSLLAAAAFAALCLLALDEFSGAKWCLAWALISACPFLWLEERKRAKDETILRELPHSLDVLAACSRAGLSFDASLARLMRGLRQGPWRDELDRLVLALKMGESRETALRALAARVELGALRSFVLAAVQAEKQGLPIAAMLEEQATSARENLFRRLEGAAAVAPVKLLFPLVLFIFPVIFIVLFVPLGMQLMALLGGGG